MEPHGTAPAVSLVDLTRLPRHVAIILDGNGRWAQERGRERADGHEQGSHAVRQVVRACRRLGIQALTLFAFSEQNWNRPRFEVEALMELLRSYLISEHDELVDNSIRLRAIGRVHKLPERVREVLDPLVQETASLDGMTLTLALSYGGREELLDAARALAAKVARGEVAPESIDEQTFELSIPSVDVGQVDLLIRTGGEQRISNFMLWGAAYAELYFSNKRWPDFEDQDLFDAIAMYQGRQRRFGRVGSAVEVVPSLGESAE